MENEYKIPNLHCIRHKYTINKYYHPVKCSKYSNVRDYEKIKVRDYVLIIRVGSY